MLAWRSSRAWEAASCVAHPGLPWTADPADARRVEVAIMTTLCRACPMLAICATVSARDDITAGFWAGTWTEPHDDGPDNLVPLPAPPIGTTAEAA